MSLGFKLVIQVPKQTTQEVLVETKILIGENEDCDLSYENAGLNSKHALFSLQQNVLMIQNLGPKGSVKIGWHKCEQGKTYILDHKDKLTLGKISIQVFEVNPEEFLQDHAQDDDEEDDEEELEEAEAPDLEHDDDDDEDDDDDDDDDDTKELDQREAPPETTSVDIGSLLKSGGSQHNATESKNHRSSKDSKTESRFSLTRTLSKIFKKSPPKLAEDKKIKRGTKPAPQLKPSKVKVKTANSRLMPGVVVRILGFTLQAAICWLIARYVIESQFHTESIETYYSQILAFIKSSILLPLGLSLELEVVLTLDLFLWAVIYFLLDLISALILSVNLGLWFFGVRETSGFITSRIKSLVRHPLGWITAPFIIFDVGILAKYRTFKEYMTRSQLEKVSPLTTFVTVLLIIPIVTMLVLLNPLIFLKEPMINISSPKLKMNDQELKPLKYFRLSSFKLDIPWSQELDNLSLVIPHPQSGLFGLEQWRDYDGPRLAILSGREFDLRQWFSDYRASNPISLFFQPLLTEFIRSSENQVLTEEIKLEIKRSIEFAHLSDYTQLQTIIDGIIQFGPLISSTIKIRQVMREKLKLEENGTLEFWDFNNKTWIVTHHKDGEMYRFHVYPLDRVPNQSFMIETDSMSFEELYHYASTVMIDFMPFREDIPAPLEKERSPSDLWAITPFIDLLNQRHSVDTQFNYSEEYLNSVIESLSFRFRQYLLNPNPEQKKQRAMFATRMEQVHSILRKDLESYNPKFRAFADNYLKLYQNFKNQDLSSYPLIPSFRTLDDNSTRE